MSFSALSLNTQLVNTLAELGYQQPTPIQVEAIPAILAKQDVMAGAQTGTGKTAAFALPILQHLIADNENLKAPKEIRALVLVPTRELALQVQQSFVKYAKGTDIRVGIAYGGVSIEAQQAVFNAGIDVLIATPGRLLDHLRQGALNLNQLNTLVFDEADRMLDMGFMDEIKAVLKQVPAHRQTLLFSATFSDDIRKLAKGLVNDPLEGACRSGNAFLKTLHAHVTRQDRRTSKYMHSASPRSRNPACLAAVQALAQRAASSRSACEISSSAAPSSPDIVSSAAATSSGPPSACSKALA